MKRSFVIAGVALVALGGCAKDVSDLEQYIGEVHARGGGRIEPLPQIKPYETFVYSASDMRSPFMPAIEDRPTTTSASSIRPDQARAREFLEQFPLDTLRMVGTINLSGSDYALVKTSDGLLHRVRVGNHMGQSEGRVIEISDSEIKLIEIISDGLGGYIERPAAVALSD
ncbi:MAG: pilus assembly protein PilP [Gammaproteobacteria bacterium]|nr:pilus assembly protein PilP [Gammaproteobacteria bacterium]NNF62220.1 pilus assembly protein PilP [Gammaproteobacteria bacterium]NNM21017.1 pilus assembly protein PilP [Gammaproteobacteria bacterium]